ncbi:MAG: hypothetical protein ACKOYL_06425 [Actinomycetota bacterium]
MTKRRPIIAAAIALTAVAGAAFATGSAGAETYNMPRRSTTTKAPSTIPMCYGGSNCTPRTKNAALPTTTKPKTVTTPMPPIKPRTKNAALPTTVAPKTATTKPRTVTTPLPPINTIKR